MQSRQTKYVIVLGIATVVLLAILMVFVATNVFESGILELHMFEQRPVAFVANYVVISATALCGIALLILAFRWNPNH